MKHFKDFEFDLPGALLANLTKILDGLTTEKLNAVSVGAIPEEQGVYQLFLDDKLVYIGKTDNEAGLARRLTRHSKKILHRQNLDPKRVSFKAVRIYVFTAVDLETSLIKHYGGVKNIAWNGSGFGSNDPGRERDTTKIKPTNFDAMYPIDIDIPLPIALAPGMTASEAMALLNANVPYTIRMERRGKKPHPDMDATLVPQFTGNPTTNEIISHVVGSLPAGWQATALMSHIIIYKENAAYPQSKILARS